MLNGGVAGSTRLPAGADAGEDGEDRGVGAPDDRAAGDRARRSLPVGTRRGERPGESGEVHALEERIGGIAQPRAGQGAGAGGGHEEQRGPAVCAEAVGRVGEENRPGRCPAGSTPGLRVDAGSGVLMAGLCPGQIGEAGGLDRAAGEGEERGIGEVEEDRHRRRDGGGQDRLVVEGERVLGDGDAESWAAGWEGDRFRLGGGEQC